MSAAHRLAASPRLTVASADNEASSRHRAAAHSAKLDKGKRKGSRSGEGECLLAGHLELRQIKRRASM